ADVPLGPTSTDAGDDLPEPGPALGLAQRDALQDIGLDPVAALAVLVRRLLVGPGPLVDDLVVVVGEQFRLEGGDLEQGGLAGVDVGAVEVAVRQDELRDVGDLVLEPDGQLDGPQRIESGRDRGPGALPSSRHLLYLPPQCLWEGGTYRPLGV